MKVSKQNNISLCFLSHSSGIAGAEKAFPKLLEGLSKFGIKINVILPSDGPVENILQRNHINYEIIKYSRWLNPKSGLIRRILRTFKNIIFTLPIIIFLKKNKINIVYTNTSTIFSGALAAKLLGIPHIWHFREFGIEDYGYSFDIGNRLSSLLLNKLSSVCFVNSIAVKEKYNKFIPSEKLAVLYEAYELENVNKIKENSFNIDKTLFNMAIVGTLHEAKGHKNALKAIYILKQKGFKVKLHIVGVGSSIYKNELLELINEFALLNEVIFYGYLENPLSVIGNCDVLLMCSRKEAFGLVTLEAMKLGVTVIGNNSGGTRELIIDNYNGLLYTHNDFKDLAEKISILITDKTKLKQLSSNAYTWSNGNFIPQKYIENTIKEIKYLLKI